MVLSRAIIIVLLTVTFFPAISMATDFIVGDEVGWTVGFDYQTWTANKVFRVGDKLSKFIYSQSFFLSHMIATICKDGKETMF